jgi:phosphatidylglycerophosphatase C
VFDFDGTLSTRDNVVPFLRLVADTKELAGALVAAAPALLASRADPAQRDLAKAIVLDRILAGLHEETLRDLGWRYARLVTARYLRPDVVARLDAHRTRGDEVVIVSASLAYYLEPVAEFLGVPTVLATTMVVDERGRLTGALARPNVRGAEKVARLDEHLRGANTVVYAYGDSRGDRELLARADHPVLVRRRGRAIPCGDWTVPR